MEVIYLLIPVSLILLGGILWVLLWAVRDGQYDDLEGPAHRILMDEDKVVDDNPKKKPTGGCRLKDSAKPKQESGHNPTHLKRPDFDIDQ
jgi:cbb3-type cytochrome oxidase maturation protein